MKAEIEYLDPPRLCRRDLAPTDRLGEAAVLRFHRLDLIHRAGLGEIAHRVALQHEPQLIGVANQAVVGLRDLDAGAGPDGDQSFGLEGLQRVAQGAEGHAQQRYQLRLRDKGAGLDPPLEQCRLEAVVGELAERQIAA